MQYFSTRRLVRAGLIATIYLVLTLAFSPLAFGPIQFRISEVLTILPILMAEAVPGLFVGCLLANLIAGAPWQDVLFGSLATLFAAMLTYMLRKKTLLAVISPVVVNALVIGLMFVWTQHLPFFFTAAQVASGQIGACVVLGLPLLWTLKRLPNEIFMSR